MEIETERSNPDIRKSSPSSNANQFPSYICSIPSYILTSLCLILSCTIQFFVVVAIIAIPLRWSLLIDIFKWNANSKRTSSTVLPTHTHTHSVPLRNICCARKQYGMPSSLLHCPSRPNRRDVHSGCICVLPTFQLILSSELHTERCEQFCSKLSRLLKTTLPSKHTHTHARGVILFAVVCVHA